MFPTSLERGVGVRETTWPGTGDTARMGMRMVLRAVKPGV